VGEAAGRVQGFTSTAFPVSMAGTIIASGKSHMPKVLDLYGYSIEMYSNDHPPPHCHVRGHGGRAKFNLHCPTGPVELVKQHGISRSDLGSLERALNESIDLLCKKWMKQP